ncbi:MAG TPA: flagellar biosynthesis protein FlhF, partial [Pseudoxanthomonas sp.]|nr:flagellar biosynthesis protein FlhF [Pseudoxanthomonas sp.]
MKIKRFVAPDMRTAFAMVRKEHGPDAVILSNRMVEDGIEIVAATNYDESLVHRTLEAMRPQSPPALADDTFERGASGSARAHMSGAQTPAEAAADYFRPRTPAPAAKPKAKPEARRQA